MVNDGIPGAVEAVGQHALRDGHAHAVGKPLPKWASGCFHARCVPVLGMPGRFAVPLAKALKFLQGEGTAQVKQGIEEHGPVPCGKDEAVTVGPVGIGWIVFEEARPEDERGVGHAHRHTRMPRVGLLHRVHSQGADGVDAELFNVLAHGSLPAPDSRSLAPAPDFRSLPDFGSLERQAVSQSISISGSFASTERWRPSRGSMRSAMRAMTSGMVVYSISSIGRR